MNFSQWLPLNNLTYFRKLNHARRLTNFFCQWKSVDTIFGWITCSTMKHLKYSLKTKKNCLCLKKLSTQTASVVANIFYTNISFWFWFWYFFTFLVRFSHWIKSFSISRFWRSRFPPKCFTTLTTNLCCLKRQRYQLAPFRAVWPDG